MSVVASWWLCNMVTCRIDVAICRIFQFLCVRQIFSLNVGVPTMGKTKLYLQALVFIFLNGNHKCGTSGVDTTIVVWRSDVWWKSDGETVYSSLSFGKEYWKVYCICWTFVVFGYEAYEREAGACWHECSRSTVIFVVSESFYIIRWRGGRGRGQGVRFVGG
jgi:hypothetical protein